MKILYVATMAGTMNFFPEHIRMLQESGHIVELATNLTNSERKFHQALRDRNCKCYHIPFSRSPFSKDNLTAYRELKRLLAENHYDIVHTHTPNASALVRLACRTLRKNGTRVFYTAHGFHFYAGAPMKNWLIYYPVEQFLSRWTDVLITINQEDFQRARTKFHARQTAYVPGIGMDVEAFTLGNYTPGGRRAELGIPQEATLLLSVGELNGNKNHAAMIRAMAKLNDPSVFYVICGEGGKRAELETLAQELNLADRVKLLGVRRDVAQWMADADIYMFPSYREGLSVSMMEAMASGLPVICSDIRGNRDLIQAGQGGLLCNPASPDEFAAAMKKLLAQPELRTQMGQHNREAVKAFSKEKVLDELRKIYEVDRKVGEECVSSM